MEKRIVPMILDRKPPDHTGMRSEKGAVLLVVIVLSTIILAVMTTLIYMITVGSQIGGLEKRYRTVHDAAFGGWEVMRQVVAFQGTSATQASYLQSLNNAPYSLSASITTPLTGCTGTTSNGTLYSGFQAKLLAQSSRWSGCDASLSITPATSTTYDVTMLLGTGTKYNVYAKIVNTVEGNSANDPGKLRGKGVVSPNAGEITVVPMPYLYTIEIDAENAANPSERAKLSVLYQY